MQLEDATKAAALAKACSHGAVDCKKAKLLSEFFSSQARAILEPRANPNPNPNPNPKGYMRTSTLVSNTGVALYNSSIGRITSAQPKKYQTSLPMINIEKTVHTLCAVLGHQVPLHPQHTSLHPHYTHTRLV